MNMFARSKYGDRAYLINNISGGDKINNKDNKNNYCNIN